MGLVDRLPGIDGENTTRRNVLVGSGYVFGGLIALGAIAADPATDNEETGGPIDDDEPVGEYIEEVYLRLTVTDETNERPPADDAEVWVRGVGSWWIDLESGSDVLEEAGPFRYDTTEGDIFAYPDGRDGVEIPVVVYFAEDYKSASVRDMVTIEIHDRAVQISGTPVEAYHDEFTVSFDR